MLYFSMKWLKKEWECQLCCTGKSSHCIQLVISNTPLKIDDMRQFKAQAQLILIHRSSVLEMLLMKMGSLVFLGLRE